MPKSGRWEIRKDDELFLSGFGTAHQAALIAKQHGIILSFYQQKTERVA